MMPEGYQLQKFTGKMLVQRGLGWSELLSSD